VYITERTRINSYITLDPQLVHSFNAFEPVEVGKLSVYAFPKLHDAVDPHSFIVSSAAVRVGIFTDIGDACNNVVDSFVRCNAVFLESNYDEEMLMKGRYPHYLKQRIRGGKGHLSNSQAFQLFTQHRSPFLSHLVLSHLSKENNSPDLVYDLFRPSARNTTVVVASRYKETELFNVAADSQPPPAPAARPLHTQLKLF
jgi:phosphoribosyl 1,2-cyclic phosphodiesterase